ncbi:MAG: hypothetical protein Q4A60_08130 [Pasteurellaceae bacterium]|nr:hypothetical protein [Pasteurellaceae bacterium]
MSVSLQCEFWAVGQGLFSSGKILSGGNPTFSWVYDCGTVSRKIFLENAIDQMVSQYSEPELDLLVISHFDKDHISGLPYLLGKKSANYWLLPYAPLWQRLLILLMQDNDIQEDEFEFYLNPIQYLETHYPEAIQGKTILLVPSTEQAVRVSENHDDNDVFYFVPQDPQDETMADEVALWNRKSKAEVTVVDPTKAMQHQGVESIPYNMPLSYLPKQSANLNQFQIDVQNIVQSNLSTQNKIKQLRHHYDQHFGKHSLNRNIISLFLYISTVLPTNQKPSKQKTAVLYCGDGDLHNPLYVDLLENALTPARFTNIYVFQVPHHGAESNSYNGLAQHIQPATSIFSARPDDKRYSHPSSQVLRDFAAYRPQITDTTNTISFSI